MLRTSASAIRALAGRFAHLRPAMRAFAALVDEGLADRSSAPTVDHDAVVERVARAYTLAKDAQAARPSAYQPGAIWAQDIAELRRRYLVALERGDIATLGSLLDQFFRNEGVAGLWSYGYYEDIAAADVVGKRIFAERILIDIATWRDVVDHADLSELDPPRVGNPWGCVLEGHLVMPVSPRHHYYAARARDVLARIERPMVAEIGGGFGGFAYFLLRSLPNCAYVDFDLPEVLLIAAYYLLRSMPERRTILYGEGDLGREVLETHDIALMPNFELPRLPDRSVDLFINTGSLSEMDRHTVAEYIEQITRSCAGYFFHENSDRATFVGGGTEVPASEFPISAEAFVRLSRTRSPWGGNDSRYREYLYARARAQTSLT